MEITKCITTSATSITPKAWDSFYRLATGDSMEHRISDDEASEMFTAYKKGAYGFFLYVNEDYDQRKEVEFEYNKCIRELYDFAIRNKAGMIIIDTDASNAEGLDDYEGEWEECCECCGHCQSEYSERR